MQPKRVVVNASFQIGKIMFVAVANNFEMMNADHIFINRLPAWSEIHCIGLPCDYSYCWSFDSIGLFNRGDDNGFLGEVF